MKKTNKNRRTFNKMALLICILNLICMGLAVILPVREPPVWEEIGPEDVGCPNMVGSAPSVKDTTPVSCRRVSRQSNHIETGYWCVGVVMITRCTEGCLGGTSVDYMTKEYPVSMEDCKDALHSYLRGDLSVPKYLPAQCSWCTSNAEEEKTVLVVREDIPYDPLTNSYPIGGIDSSSCDQTHCLTSKPSKIWMRWNTHVSDCFNADSETFGFFKNSSGSYALDHLRRIYHLSSSCLLKYCGKSVIYVPGQEILDCDGQMDKVLKVRSCPSQVKIEVNPSNQDVIVEDMLLQRELLESKCQDVIEKLRDGGSISPSDLYLLSKKTPGEGYVYIVDSSHRLRRGLTTYKDLTISQTYKNPSASMSNDSGITVKWSLWTKLGKAGLYLGPNGIVWDDSRHRLILPGLLYNSILNLDIQLTSKKLELDEEWDKEKESSILTLVKDSIMQHDHSKNVLDVVASAGGSAVSGLITYIIRTAIYVVCAIVVGKITYLLMKRILGFRNKKAAVSPVSYDLVRFINGPTPGVALGKSGNQAGPPSKV